MLAARRVASLSTLSRLEHLGDTPFPWQGHRVLFERFCISFETP